MPCFRGPMPGWWDVHTLTAPFQHTDSIDVDFATAFEGIEARCEFDRAGVLVRRFRDSNAVGFELLACRANDRTVSFVIVQMTLDFRDMSCLACSA